MTFLEAYAYFYDSIYRDKNYKEECDFIESILNRYSEKHVCEILDIGCGTGSHACLLAKKGYKVCGIDLSESMLKIAREKAIKQCVSLDIHLADIRNFNLNRKFDAVISMFAVMSYQSDNEDVENALKHVRAHLNKDGLFVFDVWFGPAVLTIKPTERIKEIENGQTKILRIAKPDIDIYKHLVKVNYRIMHILDDRIIKDIRESHSMRFFFPQELKYFLQKADFTIEKIIPFKKMNKEATVEDWNITVIAKAN
jgi:SAM-dependent methyltransferase